MSTLFDDKQRNSGLKIIANQQVHGMRTHLDEQDHGTEVGSVEAGIFGVESSAFGTMFERWSGRRGSNPRRPAWEIKRRL
jgi:hypothetical protein